jgi:hypothetical protein
MAKKGRWFSGLLTEKKKEWEMGAAVRGGWKRRG